MERERERDHPKEREKSMLVLNLLKLLRISGSAESSCEIMIKVFPSVKLGSAMPYIKPKGKPLVSKLNVLGGENKRSRYRVRITCPPVVLGTTDIEAISTYVWAVRKMSTQTW